MTKALQAHPECQGIRLIKLTPLEQNQGLANWDAEFAAEPGVTMSAECKRVLLGAKHAIQQRFDLASAAKGNRQCLRNHDKQQCDHRDDAINLPEGLKRPGKGLLDKTSGQIGTAIWFLLMQRKARRAWHPGFSQSPSVWPKRCGLAAMR